LLDFRVPGAGNNGGTAFTHYPDTLAALCQLLGLNGLNHRLISILFRPLPGILAVDPGGTVGNSTVDEMSLSFAVGIRNIPTARFFMYGCHGSIPFW
jgi:hypothetical protein